MAIKNNTLTMPVFKNKIQSGGISSKTLSGGGVRIAQPPWRGKTNVFPWQILLARERVNAPGRASCQLTGVGLTADASSAFSSLVVVLIYLCYDITGKSAFRGNTKTTRFKEVTNLLFLALGSSLSLHQVVTYIFSAQIIINKLW